MNTPVKILGIETSCDETAVAVVNDRREILSHLVLSQIKEHEVFGGVVPEIAARAHLDHLDLLIKGAMRDAKIGFHELGGIAATCGPGLIGGVMVGMMAGKAIAAAHNLPFIAVNHLEAHLLTPRLSDNIEFPYLVLLVSGGHTQLLVAESLGAYRRWGTTLDDALGECFDKSAKLMGLPYPGGPNLEHAANQCKNPKKAIERFPLPRPMAERSGCDFSFSGLKTAVRNHVQKLPEGPLQMDDVADLACAFQTSVAEILVSRCQNAILRFQDEYREKAKETTFVICGGVAANLTVRNALKDLTKAAKIAFIAPPQGLCSDNGAMIAWVGIEKKSQNKTDPLDIAARPRWPLDPKAEPRTGGGVKA